MGSIRNPRPGRRRSRNCSPAPRRPCSSASTTRSARRSPRRPARTASGSRASRSTPCAPAAGRGHPRHAGLRQRRPADHRPRLHPGVRRRQRGRRQRHQHDPARPRVREGARVRHVHRGQPVPQALLFYDGMQEDLEPESTFCGKVQAAVEKRVDEGFVDRRAHRGADQGSRPRVALDRSRAYAAAGAEGILIHHKGARPDARARVRRPLVPHRERTARLRADHVPPGDATGRSTPPGFRLVIFANYGVRTIVKALQTTFGTVMENKCLADAAEHVVVDGRGLPADLRRRAEGK